MKASHKKRLLKKAAELDRKRAALRKAESAPQTFRDYHMCKQEQRNLEHEAQELREAFNEAIQETDQEKQAAVDENTRLSAELEARNRELKEAREQLGALRADFDNYRKIAEEHQKKFIEETNAKFKDKIAEMRADSTRTRERLERTLDQKVAEAADKILKDFFPVLDGIDLALANLRQKAQEDDPYLKGFETTRQQLLGFLAKQGIEPMPELVGKPYDPNLAEAMSVLELPGKEPGSVLFLQRQGYLRGDKVVRAAQVVIQKEDDSATPLPPAAEAMEAEAAPAATEEAKAAEPAPEAVPETKAEAQTEA